MKRRDFVKMMENDGWSLHHHGNKHDRYRLGSHSFTVPRHKEISPVVQATYKRLMKEIKGK